MDIEEMYENTLKRCENLERQVLTLEEANKKLAEENKKLKDHIEMLAKAEWSDEL